MNQLLNLLKANAGRGKFWAKHEDAESHVYIYDVIVSDDYFGGVSALNVVKEIRNTTADTLHLHINSPGGDVFAARAIEQAIRAFKGLTFSHVEGVAASAATFIAVASDESDIIPGGDFMIHNAWSIAVGNAADFEATAKLLSEVDRTIADTYVGKTGAKIEDIKRFMDNETHFFGQKAVDAGFIDRLSTEDQIIDKIEWDLSALKYEPVKAKIIKETEPEKVIDIGHYQRVAAMRIARI